MPFVKSDFWRHKDVNIIEFGTGDIQMTKMLLQENRELCIAFHIGSEGEIGRTTNEYAGKPVDEMSEIKTLFVFKKKESIDAVIETLQELKTEFEKISV